MVIGSQDIATACPMRAPTPTSFTAKATGDLDCDGTEIVYTLVGTAVNGNPAVELIEPAIDAD
jgi:hypothetical protein